MVGLTTGHLCFVTFSFSVLFWAEMPQELLGVKEVGSTKLLS